MPRRCRAATRRSSWRRIWPLPASPGSRTTWRRRPITSPERSARFVPSSGWRSSSSSRSAGSRRRPERSMPPAGISPMRYRPTGAVRPPTHCAPSSTERRSTWRCGPETSTTRCGGSRRTSPSMDEARDCPGAPAGAGGRRGRPGRIDWCPTAASDESLPRRIDALLAGANVLVAAGDDERAINLVAEATRLGEPRRFVRRLAVFEAGDPVLGILNRLTDPSLDPELGLASPAYVDLLITAAAAVLRPLIAARPAVELVDPFERPGDRGARTSESGLEHTAIWPTSSSSPGTR